MGLFDDCKEYFNTEDLYQVLGISRTATDAEIKQAYKKISLLCHPDRVTNDKKDEATKKFQTLSKVHCILSDKEKRIVYDETGSVDEENISSEKDWEQYWRLLFPKITMKDIDDFMSKYKGSAEELEDLKKCYIQYEGDMNKISESFVGYDCSEEEEYRKIITDLIKKGELPEFTNFTKEKKAKREARIKRFKKEEKEAEQAKDEIDSSLINAIAQRSQNRESNFNDMIKSLEEKYAKPQKKGSSKKGKK